MNVSRKTSYKPGEGDVCDKGDTCDEGIACDEKELVLAAVTIGEEGGSSSGKALGGSSSGKALQYGALQQRLVDRLRSNDSQVFEHPCFFSVMFPVSFHFRVEKQKPSSASQNDL